MESPVQKRRKENEHHQEIKTAKGTRKCLFFLVLLCALVALVVDP